MEPKFIKTDDNKIINMSYIRWIKELNECMKICSKMNGCDIVYYENTHTVCKINSPNSYNKLKKYFEESE